MRIYLISFFIFLASGCSTTYSNKDIAGKVFPDVTGQSLEKEEVNIPKDFNGKFTLLLVGYKQNSQFDIDRWLIGLDMTKTRVDVYEIPTIQGLFPRMFSTMINNGMRKGIPKELWKGVVTVFKDGNTVQAFTGNEAPNNTRVILLDENGKISYFYDRGFSVEALNELKTVLILNN